MGKIYGYRLRFFCLTFALFLSRPATSQCSSSINSFPYNEGFENSMGNWFVSSNSINSDWAWGTPSKAIINTAGGGNKCWITGGLSGSSYANGEASYLQSPCFDISALKNPQISFKIFWETETNYDGAGFQYSTDGGNTWTTLGSVNDETNCPASNWFNDGSVRYLVTGQGWSGYNQSGSGKWVTATHSLSAVQGAKNVSFRFAFGAGTINNNYDGFAADDIFIGETPVSIDFTYTCQPNNTVNFNAQSSGCAPVFLWNFGDAASGVANTSTDQSPSHTFSAPGTYTVQCTSNGTTVQKQITVLNVTIHATEVTCHGAANGSATAIVTGGSGYQYAWSTNPPQNTPTIDQLAPGIYMLTVSAAAACAVMQSVTIAQPDTLIAGISVTNEICADKKGSVYGNATGGTPPYTYLWSGGDTTTAITHLAAGTYALAVTDAKNCTVTANDIVVSNVVTTVPVYLGRDTAFCPGQQLLLHPGNFSSYLWQDGSMNATYTVTSTGSYSVAVTDSNGCKGADSIHVTVDCRDIFFPSAFTPNSDGKNDSFGPAGNLAGVSNYTLHIYNRWGQRVFYATDPFVKWDGRIQNQEVQADVYVWFASYSINGGPKQERKGTVISIR